MRKIAYTQKDGSLAVVYPVRNTHPQVEDLTDAEVEQRAFDRLPKDAINPQFVEFIPSDKTLRHLWRVVDGVVTV